MVDVTVQRVECNHWFYRLLHGWHFGRCDVLIRPDLRARVVENKSRSEDQEASEANEPYRP